MDKSTTDAIANIEKRYFRTEHDTGAHPNALLIWNAFRKLHGLEPIYLPKWDSQTKKYLDQHGNPV